MLNQDEIYTDILEPAARELQNSLRSAKVVIDRSDRSDRPFRRASFYFSGSPGYDGERIEDVNLKRAISQQIFLTIQEEYSAESGGINPQITGVGISIDTELYIDPPDWEAMAGDLPPKQLGYALDVWFIFVTWPKVEAGVFSEVSAD